MTRREQIRIIKRVWAYLQRSLTDAYECKDEAAFDWYSDGQQAFWCLITKQPIQLTKRVKPLL